MSHPRTDVARDPTAEVIRRLEAGGFDPRTSGPDRWESRCPAHRGSRHNLSVRRGDDGRALVCCHHADDQGPPCTAEAIARALDLTTADLFPNGLRGDGAPSNGRPKGGKKDRDAARRTWGT